jgi:hypothetical protein
MHPVITVDKCKRYLDPNLFEGRPQSDRSPPVEGGLADKYEVEEVLDERVRRGELEYFVGWKGYGKEDQQWVAADQFDDDDEVVLAFRERRGRRGQVLSYRKGNGQGKQNQAPEGLRKG